LNIHRTESEGDPSESEGDSSVNPKIAVTERGHEFGEPGQTEGINQQSLLASSSLKAGRAPVGPLARQRERSQIRVAQAQRLDTGDSPDLQNDEPLPP
jgi:hypothetical protein